MQLLFNVFKTVFKFPRTSGSLSKLCRTWTFYCPFGGTVNKDIPHLIFFQLGSDTQPIRYRILIGAINTVHILFSVFRKVT